MSVHIEENKFGSQMSTNSQYSSSSSSYYYYYYYYIKLKQILPETTVLRVNFTEMLPTIQLLKQDTIGSAMDYRILE